MSDALEGMEAMPELGDDEATVPEEADDEVFADPGDAFEDDPEAVMENVGVVEMTILQRIARQPAKLLAAVQAVIGLGLILGWFQAENIDQITGAVLLALSAILAAVSEYLTPTYDPVLPVGTIVNASTDKLPTSTVVEQ
jgi:hypothetical protein